MLCIVRCCKLGLSLIHILVSLDKPGKSSTVHWRIGDAKGNQVVLEFVDGVPHFYENRVGVLLSLIHI